VQFKFLAILPLMLSLSLLAACEPTGTTAPEAGEQEGEVQPGGEAEEEEGEDGEEEEEEEGEDD
jgi:ribosomal protein L12E/L44/L45/RPP1/RPP2